MGRVAPEGRLPGARRRGGRRRAWLRVVRRLPLLARLPLHRRAHGASARRPARGPGAPGPALVAALFEPARALGKHAMIGGIDADNEASIRMHERLGFEKVAHLPEVGRKFGRWLDLVLVQRLLDLRGAARED